MAAEEKGHIPFAVPDITDREIEAVVRCLKSGWLTTGPVAKEFEKEFSRRMGGGVEAISVNSCTTALQVALKALDVGPGDEVIVPVWTFTATAMSVVHAGARPVLVDVDTVTLNLDPERAAAAVTPRTRAIIPVHFAGLACDMDALRAIADGHNLKIIEDAAHALPATYKGRLIGADSADATAFSFYATKTMTTGEGGMITVADPEIAARCRTLRLHGINRDVFDRYTSASSPWYYEVVAPGFKCNLTDMAAAIGLVQLERLDEMLARRCALRKVYHEAFADLPLELPPDAPEGDIHSWHLYVVKLRPEAPLDRDEFIKAMAAEKIGCSVHFIPLHLHPYWRDSLGVTEADFPNATAAYKRAVSLPFYTAMTDAAVERVTGTVRRLLKRGG